MERGGRSTWLRRRTCRPKAVCRPRVWYRHRREIARYRLCRGNRYRLCRSNKEAVNAIVKSNRQNQGMSPSHFSSAEYRSWRGLHATERACCDLSMRCQISVPSSAGTVGSDTSASRTFSTWSGSTADDRQVTWLGGCKNVVLARLSFEQPVKEGRQAFLPQRVAKPRTWGLGLNCVRTQLQDFITS